ncbi:DUF937 domain-containing protein [Leptolyngbyaceae cyanobacterium CCMR0082]|uniref:DUF937 domain-containing protein n=2 Tax=Adonisia turfae TaxID=2950184 RepID=A0A6M0SDB3_9CYAN|nr:DUF937 domain-containing protein [Adonisia turfae]MDV3352811.1 DUF937 domain-containing protein [Leptothoe sp. LEGE 181152]NEZ56312.1 DUF937 domain-containing protein [Adonisia turfae CCMR0081]NEZ65961.1 DUF937 domain-containing protein [Adonisia turfae CCMR0082]
MGIFDQVMGAIQDPNREASIGQLGQIVSMAQQVAQSNNANPSATQQAASVVGGFVQSALREKQQAQGMDAVLDLVKQGTTDGAGVLPQLFSPAQQSAVAAAVAEKTGLDANQVQAMLPMVIPIVMKFLNQGAAKSGTQAQGNPLVTAFLDGDGDGDVDMGDILKMAGRFM